MTHWEKKEQEAYERMYKKTLHILWTILISLITTLIVLKVFLG